jgi:putative nucleotidyltransferase with HDIG domain
MEFLLLAITAGAILAWWVAALVAEKRAHGPLYLRNKRAAKPQPQAAAAPDAGVAVGAGIRWKLRPQSEGFSVAYGVVEEVNQSLRRVPPLSQAMIRLMRELGSEASSAQTVGEILGDEPVLAAALLRMANSSATGLRREILSVPEAVAYLGFSTTKSLLLRMHLGSLIPAPASGVGYDAAKLWVHAMAVAHVSEELAHRAAGADPSLALTAGLLHDIGKIAINTQFPQKVSELLAAGTGTAAGMLDRERQLFGADHAVLGGQLAEQWTLPAGLVDVIRLHHSIPALPETLPPATRRTLLCVHMANQLVKQAHAYCDCVELDPIAPQVTEELGLPDDPERLLDARVDGIIRRVFQINDVQADPPAPLNRAA